MRRSRFAVAVLFGVASSLLWFAGPASGASIHTDQTYDGCSYRIQLAGDSSYSTLSTAFIFNGPGTSCATTKKSKLGYWNAEAAAKSTNYEDYDTVISSTTRSNSVPRYARGCAWSSSRSSWGCHSIWW